MFGPPLRRGHRFANTIGAGEYRCANSRGAGHIGAPIYWRTDVPLRQ
jgi:hypothetical protein